MSNFPKWLIPYRKTALLDLFARSRGFCVFGHTPCQFPTHHYVNFIDDLIHDWQSEDRQERLAQVKAELIALHRTSDRFLPLTGEFSGVSKDIFFADQPIYYILAYGFNCLTFKPFAQVRISSSYIVLYVELETLAYSRISKNKKRKSIRYHKRVDYIDQQVNLAVKHYRGE